MRALVTYGSKMGGTRGLADMVGRAFEEHGFTVDVSAAREADPGAGYDVIVVGGALYAGRWHRDAARLVRRNVAALRDRDVWFFSSGPLDDSATKRDIPPVKQVRKLMDKVGAQGHATFGGRLEKQPRRGGSLAGLMAKSMAGDWRDVAEVERWVGEVVAIHNQRLTPIPEF